MIERLTLSEFPVVSWCARTEHGVHFEIHQRGRRRSYDGVA